jgi:hypothetical protein
MPTETVSRNERGAPPAASDTDVHRDEDALREVALRHLERVRRFKLYLATYLLAMLVLTPVWIVTQYQTADGWPKHLSSRSRYAGDWDPWIIWVALGGAVLVAILGFRAYFDRPETEAEIEREISRIKTH